MKSRTKSEPDLEILSGGRPSPAAAAGGARSPGAAGIYRSVAISRTSANNSPYRLPGVAMEDGDDGLSSNDGDDYADTTAAMPPPPLPVPSSPIQRSVTSDFYSSPHTSSQQQQWRRLSVDKQLHRVLELRRTTSRIFDDPAVTAGYASVPTLEQDELPRGGISVDTAAVGRVQFGIPPETIKDSMMLGIQVPRVYIVPTERFCSDLGPALGINLAEFEFPAYFNWFVRRKKCCLVVDSVDAENNIRSVFEETLLGPQQFRDPHRVVANDEQDFDPDFPLDARPNFYKEFQFFRVSEKTETYSELTTDMLLDFYHFDKGGRSSSSRGGNLDASSELMMDSFAMANELIGVPPVAPDPGDDGQNQEGELSLSDLLGFEDEQQQQGGVAVVDDFHKSLGALVFNSQEQQPQPQQPESNRKTARFAEGPQPTNNTSTSTGEQKEQPPNSHAKRRASLESVESTFTNASANTVESMRSDTAAPEKPWMYSQLKWLGEVATVWPMDATPEQIQQRSVPRVEIFKMAGNGTEYIIHDVDANNIIIGKARLRGTVCVPDEIAVEGFLSSGSSSKDLPGTVDDPGNLVDSASSTGYSSRHAKPIPHPPPKALFHPPSFGVTVLGNSHGFDKNGSTSGYVLWINGRGIMIDPPPYASGTLERECIRPQMIFGVIITHCHADHDAGAFQKVLTGSRLTVITTPSIYTSFIRKYSALSGLSPTLLQHSHRYRRAIIGQPLKFQGATFHFTYTLHTIPCISFKVEWRGRSMVFTGDHLNLPPLLDELEQKGILSKGRADSLKQMPLQDCDALLHEAGAPPIHTPLTVLQNLPEKIKQRLYVVHTSALPPDCGLRVAPTGTAGTIRLDEMPPNRNAELTDTNSMMSSASNVGYFYDGDKDDDSLPAVLLRPSCISDAWFILNLISNIPFFGTLSYINTMEVLEVATVEVFSAGEVVVPARKRLETLCVVWEGTCTENGSDNISKAAVWHAGDWTGPTALQPNPEKAAKSGGREPPRDVVALSVQGVKVITLRMNDLNKILIRGSKLYRQYLEQESKYRSGASNPESSSAILKQDKHPASRHVLETIKINPLLGNLYARQIRALESIAEGPRVFEPGTYLWKAGDPCDFAFLIASGTASFAPPPGRTRSVMSRRMSNRQSSLRNVVEIEDGRIVQVDKMLRDLPPESEFARLELLMALRAERIAADPYYRSTDRGERNSEQKTRDRNTNKVLARLYASGKVIDGLLISRGCFLSDTSRMVSGNLIRSDEVVVEKHAHSSTVIAGSSGCVAWVFPRSAFLPFLEANPGVLLSLLGTQLVV